MTASVPAEKPDIIIVMSESFWDPTKLPGVTITPDPIPNVRALRSGYDVLAGIRRHDRQYRIRGADRLFQRLPAVWQHPLPAICAHADALAGDVPEERGLSGRAPSIPAPTGSGTAARSMPISASTTSSRKRTLPPLEKRGPLASDAAMTDEIIREADASDEPLFFFAVSLQNHGPYEPNRYYNPTHKVEAPISPWARESLLTLRRRLRRRRSRPRAADRMGEEARPADGHRLLRRPSAAARAGLCRDRLPEGQCRAAQGADAGRQRSSITRRR